MRGATSDARMNSNDLRVKALELLRQSTGDSQADFRPGQLEAIEHLLEEILEQRSNTHRDTIKCIKSAGLQSIEYRAKQKN